MVSHTNLVYLSQVILQAKQSVRLEIRISPDIGMCHRRMFWQRWVKADSHIECRAHAAPVPCPCHAVPLRVYNVSFPFDLHNAAVSDSHLPYHAHAAPMPCSDHAVLLKATAQHGRRETACGLPARVWVLPTTTRSSTKTIIRSIPVLLTTIHTYNCKEW